MSAGVEYRKLYFSRKRFSNVYHATKSVSNLEISIPIKSLEGLLYPSLSSREYNKTQQMINIGVLFSNPTPTPNLRSTILDLSQFEECQCRWRFAKFPYKGRFVGRQNRVRSRVVDKVELRLEQQELWEWLESSVASRGGGDREAGLKTPDISCLGNLHLTRCRIFAK